MANKVRIAVIGCGRIGLTHLEAIKELSDQVELIALVDMNRELLNKIAEKYRPNKTYSSIPEALRDPEIDATIIALPHNLHCPVMVQAAKAGKHVLVEKPMALSVREADCMIEAADKAGITLMVGQSRRFVPALQLSKGYLSHIGKPYNMLYIFMTLFDTSNAPGWWKAAVNTGGLAFPMLGSHTLDYSLWLFDDRRPVSVYARGYSSNDVFEGDDQCSIIITMDDGSFITNHLSINTFPAVHDCIINGPKGTMSFSHRYTKGRPVGRFETNLFVNGEMVFKDDEKEWSFLNELKEFVGAIMEKRTPAASGEIGRKVVRAIEASIESARTGKVIKF